MVPSTASSPPSKPHRIQGQLFQSIGDEGRAELVERRLLDLIHGGHLRAGHRLPAESELARTLGVAPVTVREALLALRARGLVVTKRGRNGGSFVAADADPLAFAREALRRTSRVALRDLGAHYAAITSAAVRLAARRATADEAERVQARLDRIDDSDTDRWRPALDDAQIELAALSQSARLTREQMQLQAELSPYLRLLDTDAAERARMRGDLRAAVAAVAEADAEAAVAATERSVAATINALVVMQSEIGE